MSVKTNELKQATSVNAEDYLLADSPTAGTVRIPLSAAAEYFDAELVKSGTQLHAALSNKANWNMLPNRNIFDNWYLADPINQRNGLLVVPGQDYYDTTSTANTLGQLDKYYKVDTVSGDWVIFTMNGTQYYARTQYCVSGYTTNGYFIDRWMMYRGKNILTSNGITYQWNGEFASVGLAYGIIMRQMLESKALVTGQIVTISFLLQDRMLTFTTTIPSNGSNNYVDIDPFNIMIERLENGVLGISLLTTDTQPITVIAAKLELGSQQTLAHKEGDTWVLNDPPPNKATELAKCQRYFQVLPHNLYLSGIINLGQTNVYINYNLENMRTNPSVIADLKGAHLVLDVQGSRIYLTLGKDFTISSGVKLLRLDMMESGKAKLGTLKSTPVGIWIDPSVNGVAVDTMISLSADL